MSPPQMFTVVLDRRNECIGAQAFMSFSALARSIRPFRRGTDDGSAMSPKLSDKDCPCYAIHALYKL